MTAELDHGADTAVNPGSDAGTGTGGATDGTGSGARSAHVEVLRDGGTAHVVIGDGRRRNALTSQGWTAIRDAFVGLAQDPDVRAVVVRGAGDTFCAGSDLTEWAGVDEAHVEDSFARMESAFRAVEACPVPVIAQVSGVAAGAGCQLALACDLRVVTGSARVGMPIARLGIRTSPSFAARMSTLAGPSVTRDLLYTGRLLHGADAVSAGLADRCVAEDELSATVGDMAASIARQPAEAVRAAKSAVETALAPVRTATLHNTGPAVAFDRFSGAVADFVR
ncbi:enoyl-CoA hydratase/isomerase family protein [Nocardiopsis sp. HNM0947]|uniref:Enoyl-CoA hydratase/isomerase family protein n=1 Tax=Nocardiopsis coralli TaxID=2772213 RepID=A0ABR9P5T7_9ACTN|nr:enoyl-CoA hydratase/isomerase family protein [Nocardiopsis coralli]MBE2999213.1 enoyl-CoA hydratase/isomerase family protein [Nocardiopsis coralli]